MSPFKVLYGYEPPQLLLKLIAQSKVDDVKKILIERQILAKVLKENFTKAQSRMKMYADRKRTGRNLRKGIGCSLSYNLIGKHLWLWGKLSSLRPDFMDHTRLWKRLDMSRIDEHCLLQQGYILVFHVSQLKKKVGSQMIATLDPPICSPEGQPLVEPVVILDRRIIKRGTKLLTKWWFNG